MAKKKLLIFIDWYLPGYKAGGPIQSVANLVAHLKEEFAISIVTRDTDYCETLPYSTVKSDEWNELPDGTRVFYFSSKGLTRSAIRHLLQKTETDLVYLNGIFSLYFTLIPLFFLRRKKNVRVVIAGRGMFASSALGVKKTKKQIFLTSVKVLKLFDDVVFHATNENEKKDIVKVIGSSVQVITAGNLPQKVDIPVWSQKKKDGSGVRLINIARIAPEKNLLFALKVLQKISVPVEFDFYGPVYSAEYWRECQAMLEALPSNVKATYKGSVESEKVLELFNNYHFMFMPTLGENFGHVILQSLSAGCPVIISDQTPWKGLESSRSGWDLNLNSIDSFKKVIRLASEMEQDEYDTMSRSASALGASYINDAEILEQNRRLFRV